VKSTRLRYISAKTAAALTAAVSALPFKVEIKGGPTLRGGRWYVFFVLPENPGIDFKNLELKK
jgi:hypothetical protein